MTAARRPWAADLLHLWFHRLRPADWFQPPVEIDELLRQRYGSLLQALRAEPARRFLTDPRTARAAVLLFDQVPRNIHRDSTDAFASDPLARAIAKGALARGWDETLGKTQRQFLYMPLMHSENRRDQALSLSLFTALGDPTVVAFAKAHREMVDRFGRFPHRNRILGRKSIAAERKAVQEGFRW